MTAMNKTYRLSLSSAIIWYDHSTMEVTPNWFRNYGLHGPLVTLSKVYSFELMFMPSTWSVATLNKEWI